MTMTILLIDDDADVLDVLHEAFKERGYHCVVTTNGREALDLIKNQKFDAVVTDVIMPDVTGRAIATLCDVQRIPCVAISGSLELAEPGMPPRVILVEKDGNLDRLMAALTLQLHRHRHIPAPKAG
jgi:CheY-like chemotaxis protein